MKFVFFIVSLTACVICGLLGLTVGVNINPLSTVQFVPNWGSFADWVSGLGSVSAAVVALYLAFIQRRNNTAKIEIAQSFDKDHFTVDIVSTGERAAIVVGVYIRSSSHKKQVLFDHHQVEGYKKIVGRYEYGEKRQISIGGSFFDFGLYIKNELGADGFTGLQLVVDTGIAEFKVGVNQKFAERLQAAIRTPQP